MANFNDATALSFAVEQSLQINSRIYETKYPDWDFSRLVFVNTSGPEWSNGTITYTSDMSGRAAWQSGFAKDVPLADVSQDRTLRTNHMGAIGYQWNIEELNTAMQIGGGLADRRARAARMAYMKFMWEVTVRGDAVKGLAGLINQTAVVDTVAPADGTGSVTFWVDEDGVGTKTPAQIVRDINAALTGMWLASYETEMADTLLLPIEAYNYIAQTPYSTVTMDTILSFVQRTNIYTLTTGQPLTIRTLRELSTAGAGGTGRMIAYKNAENYVQLHLPMPHRFLPVYQDGPLNYTVPGIFRTGGIELLSDVAFRYVDGISQPAAA